MGVFKKIKKLLDVYGTVKTYKHKSVFYRFWILIVIAFIAVFVCVSMLVNNYNNSKHYNNMSMIFSKNMYNMRNSLDSVFAEIISEIKKINESDIIKNLNNENVSSKTILDCENILKQIHSETEFVKSIYLYNSNTDYVISSSVIYKSAPLKSFEDNNWYDVYFNGENDIFLRVYPENSIFQKCISVCKKINGSDFFAVFNMNYDKFNIIRNKNVLMEYEISMINEGGIIIYSTDNEKVGKDINLYNELCDTYFMSANNYTVNLKMTNSSLYESVRTKNLDLSIVANIPKKNIDAISPNKNSMLFVTFGILIALLVLSIMLATKFYGSIAMFVERIPLDKLDENKNNKKTDEITDISEQISNIINKKYETESELAESLMKLQKAQSIALQSQFSPHFLFNTLQMINSIALSELDGDSDITTAVKLLCDILHVAMDTTEYTCLLKDEIVLAKKYIMLQNMKYENAFNVEFDIDESTLDITVAKLFLQPILENSMHHGFDVRRQEMNINIKTRISANKLVVTVEDDGLGMSEERKKEVTENLNNKQLEKKDSIGLLNLNQRIKLIFGYEYGCTIDNNEKGVTVNIIFPNR